MYLKFGFGRTTQDAGIDVRRGAMTRAQAVQLVQMYDDIYPENLFEEYCDYYKMTMSEFQSNIDKWANKELFEKKINGFLNLKYFNMTQKKIGIIDCEFGNIASLVNAIKFLKYDYKVVNNEKSFDEFSHLILPGVGSFHEAALKLKK